MTTEEVWEQRVEQSRPLHLWRYRNSLCVCIHVSAGQFSLYYRVRGCLLETSVG